MKLMIRENVEPTLEFIINTNLKLAYVNLNVKEDWKFDKDEFSLPHKAPQNVLNDLTLQINKKIDKFVVPSLQTCLINYDCHIETKSDNTLYNNGSILKFPKQDILSYACYFDISPNYFNITCSNVIKDAISSIRLRLANHISKQELYSIANTENIKIFIQNIDDLYASKFTKCTENVLEAYTEFLNTLNTYPKRIENFADILPEHIQALKKWQKQGF